MQCGSCVEEIPDDSIFCPECGARQEMSRAGGLPGVGSIGLGGQEVSGGRNFGVVSGEAVMNQNMNQGIPGQGLPPGVMPDLMGQIAQNMQSMPQQGMPQQGMPPQGMPQNALPTSNVTPLSGQVTPNIGGSRGDMPPAAKGPSLASGAGPNTNLGAQNNQVGGLSVSNNPSLSPTDAMVNRIAEAERNVKNERRSQWLQMNQESAANVLSSIGGELPSHLKGSDNEASTAEFLANAIGSDKDGSGNDALYRRMSEVAVRRVARKRGVAVETPQIKSANGVLTVNVTYVDDGRVLDTPDDLSTAFEHAISTEVALKGLDTVVEINLFRSKDGNVEKIGSEDEPSEAESDEEMFACEVCDGLVKESDNECPHCGAMFEDDDDEEEEPVQKGPPTRGGPPGPSRGGPPGPSRGGPPGPSKSGPSGPSRGGPPGPSKSGPSGPSRGGPPGPSKGGPSGPSRGGPPKRSGPPSGGPSGGGPPGGPKKGPPSGGTSGGGPPKRGGPPGGPKRGPPGGPKRGPPK